MKNDGAVLLLIMEKDMAYELGFEHGLLFKDGVTVGVDSNFPGIGPVPAISNLLKRNQLTIENIEVIEMNEAFSAQVVAKTSFKYFKYAIKYMGWCISIRSSIRCKRCPISDAIILMLTKRL
ncbi:hypothetical protein ACVPOY_05770 [Staphylococcus aureus]